MQTKVILSVDTEFSIGGTFVDPTHNKPVGLQSVLCEKDGQSHGLGFILDTLDKYNLQATFFVEALNANYFGYDLMGQIAHTIVNRGQDIQLHIHPCWQYFKNKDWKDELKRNPANDDITKRSYQEIENILIEGVESFSQWGLARPKAIRTGSLSIKTDVYKAMKKTGIQISSNIGVGIFKPTETELELYSGCHEIEGCAELPVLTYCDMSLLGKKHLKLLTITGCSWNEIEFLLCSAAKHQLDYVVILTHPSEFIKKQNNQYTQFYSNKVNKQRFDKLCSFLQKNKINFSTITFSDLQLPAKSQPSNVLLKAPVFCTIQRLAENYLNDNLPKF